MEGSRLAGDNTGERRGRNHREPCNFWNKTVNPNTLNFPQLELQLKKIKSEKHLKRNIKNGLTEIPLRMQNNAFTETVCLES